jgi:hypothetical protein
MRKETEMPRQMRAVLGAGLLAMVITSSNAWAANHSDSGYDAVRKVGNCAEDAKKTFHADWRACRATPPGDKRAECHEDTIAAYYESFEKCYELAESYHYSHNK